LNTPNPSVASRWLNVPSQRELLPLQVFVARLALLTDNRVDRQCGYRVDKARRFLSQSRFQSQRTEGGDHPDAEEEEGRKEEALNDVVYVERRGRAALPQVCLPL
jgi:hypothetical protein